MCIVLENLKLKCLNSGENAPPIDHWNKLTIDVYRCLDCSSVISRMGKDVVSSGGICNNNPHLLLLRHSHGIHVSQSHAQKSR